MWRLCTNVTDAGRKLGTIIRAVRLLFSSLGHPPSFGRIRASHNRDTLILVAIIEGSLHNPELNRAVGSHFCRVQCSTEDLRGRMAADIRFSFKLEKLVHSLAFFSEQGIPDLTKLKAAKLLYFADKEHLLRYGRPILGDVYFCLPYGPVPSIALNEMTDAIAGGAEVRLEDAQADVNLFRSVLEVRLPMFSKNAVFTAKKAHDPDVFSDSELEVLTEVAAKYGRYTAGKLVDLTHAEPTWQKANECREPQGRTPIPYSSFFEDSANGKELLEMVIAEQEESAEFDRLFANIHAVR